MHRPLVSQSLQELPFRILRGVCFPYRVFRKELSSVESSAEHGMQQKQVEGDIAVKKNKNGLSRWERHFQERYIVDVESILRPPSEPRRILRLALKQRLEATLWAGQAV